MTGPATLLALPIATWEFSLGVWLTIKGFRTRPEALASPEIGEVPVHAGAAA